MFTDSKGYGGAASVLLSLVDGLDRRRWRPTLVYHPIDGVEPLIAAARARELDLWAIPEMPEGLAGAARVPRLVAALRSRRPAVFHAHLTWPISCKFALLSAVLARVPAVVATEHLFVDFPLTRASYLQQRALGAAVGRYIAVSEYVKRRLIETFGWPPSKIDVVRNGVDVDGARVHPDPALRSALTRGGSRLVVLVVARLVPEKGVAVMLAAARELPEAQVVIAGDGPERDELERSARELGVADRVDFLGYRSDVAQLLACSDVVVLPSLNEGLPLAVLEAMGDAKPIVATAIGGTDETIDDRRTGLLVAPGDAAALASAVRELLSDTALAAALARAAATEVAASFTREQMLARVTGIYEQLLDRSGAVRGGMPA
jgi:glycosyltransferase involved in cell wall biosynthesis